MKRNNILSITAAILVVGGFFSIRPLGILYALIIIIIGTIIGIVQRRKNKKDTIALISIIIGLIVIIFFIVGFLIGYFPAFYNNNSDYLKLFFVLSVLANYFLFSLNILKKINNKWLRSSLSALIAIILTIIIIYAYNTITDYQSHNRIDNTLKKEGNISKLLKQKLNQQNKYILEFTEKDKPLSEKFYPEPSSTKEIETNILILHKWLPLYNEKDSTLISSYNDILKIIASSEKWNFLEKEVHSIVEIGSLLKVENQKYMNNLLNYYISVKKKNNQQDKYLKLYTKSFTEIQRLQKKLIPIITKFSGENFDVPLK